MNFQQCHYLIAIDRYHSISQAARALFVTQPSISQAINQLEQELKIHILTRTNRGVNFTQEGRELLQYARLLVEEEQNIHYHFNQLKARPRVTIASQHYGFVALAVARVVNNLQEGYRLTLKEGRAAAAVQQVATGQASVGVIAIATANRQLIDRQLVTAQIAFHELLTSPVRVFLRHQHPLAGKKAISPLDLIDYPNLTYRQDDPAQTMLEWPMINQPGKQTVYISDRATMDTLLATTDGYNIGTGILSDEYMRKHLTSRLLAVPWQITVGYLTKDNAHLSAIATDFIHELCQLFKK